MPEKDRKTYIAAPAMDYHEYRSQFETVEEFLKHFATLSEDEVYAMISRTDTGTTSKACMFTTWKMAREEYSSVL